ncbi:ATP synthase F0 subunit B [Streptomyces sp. NBC_01216]|uniref:ATP synthase F0 subunit B n=1 Tax=unclassified Streptomyces TaxID=2593676 RepID=UPI002E148BF0|nr:ATP synthase F0 subunit B [Streptomyces sp. NBC_01216]
MDVQKKLDEIVSTITNARSMPMSASCVVNRAELLAALEEVREALPGSLAQAQELLGGREHMVEQARQEAERIIEAAHLERGSLISDTQVARQSQDEADRILGEARREAEEIRAEADDYVDSKLANFEVVLNKTIGSVDRGREKLLSRGPGGAEHGYTDEGDPEYAADPRQLIQRIDEADEFIAAKLGAFEAVLGKTLEAVGRGRQTLHGRIATDELGAHMAAQDAAAGTVHTSDADYLAGLAELADPEPVRQPAPQIPAQQPDPYGYPQQSQDVYAADTAYADEYVGSQDSYAYQAQDPYAYQQPQHQQTDPYGYQQPAPQQQAALDETSFFDTSMIDLEQLRRYEQGH